MQEIEQNKLEGKGEQNIEAFLKNLRIVDLEIFVSAALMKNLGKAAAAHHLSQSAASTVIQRVETAFRTDLCTHEKRRFRLTGEGRRLLPKIEKIIQQVRGLILQDKLPSIRLATTHAIAQVAVPFLLSFDKIDFKYMRPDQAYTATLRSEADMALVLDNFPWKGVVATEIGQGNFQLYSRKKDEILKPVLLPEEQIEVLCLKQTWLRKYGYSLPVKAKIPSWSLIGQICEESDEIGFLPDFLAKKYGLHPVVWQPEPSQYRILAIYREGENQLQERICSILNKLSTVFVDF